MDPAPFNTKIKNNHSSIGGHSLETCISEDVGNACDSNSNLVIYIPCVYKGKPGIAYVTLGDGCDNIKHALTLDNPVRKGHSKIGARNDGFLASTCALGTTHLTLLSRTSKKRVIRALELNILGLTQSIDKNGLGVDYNEFMEVQTNLSPEDQEEFERLAKEINHEPTKHLMMSLADPKSIISFFFAFRAGMNLDISSIHKVIPFLNSNFFQKLNEGLKIQFLHENEIIECNRATSISLIEHQLHPVFTINFSLSKDCTVLYFKINDVYVRMTRDSFTECETQKVQKELFERDEKDETEGEEKWEGVFRMCVMSDDMMTNFSKILNVSIKDVRGLRMLRNGVLLGNPIFREKLWGSLQNAGGFMPSLEIMTSHMNEERNKLYIDKLLPLPAKKHTYVGENIHHLIDSFINKCCKALMQFCKQGATTKTSGVTDWSEHVPDILTSLGIIPKKELVNTQTLASSQSMNLPMNLPYEAAKANGIPETSQMTRVANSSNTNSKTSTNSSSSSSANFQKAETSSTLAKSSASSSANSQKTETKPDIQKSKPNPPLEKSRANTITETIKDIEKLKKDEAKELLDKYGLSYSKNATRDEFIQLLIENHPHAYTWQQVKEYILKMSDKTRHLKTSKSTEVLNYLKTHFTV
jgi:hypothetical protein